MLLSGQSPFFICLKSMYCFHSKGKNLGRRLSKFGDKTKLPVLPAPQGLQSLMTTVALGGGTDACAHPGTGLHTCTHTSSSDSVQSPHTSLSLLTLLGLCRQPPQSFFFFTEFLILWANKCNATCAF